MNRIHTLLLALLVIAALIAITILRPDLETTLERDQRGDSLLDFELSQVTGLNIRIGKDTLELKKTGDTWQMGPTIKDRASPQMVYQILEHIKQLQVQNIIPASEFQRDLKSGNFGLSNPKQRIEIELGQKKYHLIIGKEGAGENQVFVRLGQSEDTYLVEDAFLQLITQPLESFRDARLTELLPDQIERIQILRGPSETELRKDNLKWNLQRPLQTPADSAKVEKLLSRLLGARVIAFLDESELATVGTLDSLGTPQSEIRFWVEGNDSPQTLRLIGPGPVREGFPTLLVEYPEREAYLYVAKEPLALAVATAEELRDRSPLQLNLDAVDRLQIQHGNTTETLTRTGENDWKNETADGQAQRVRDLTDAIHSIQLTHFTPTPAPKTVDFIEVQFNAWLSENTPETTAGVHPVGKIWIGRTPEGKVFVRTHDSPEHFETSPESWDSVIKSASQSPPTESNPTPSPTP